MTSIPRLSVRLRAGAAGSLVFIVTYSSWLSVTLSTGGHLLMIDAPPLNVMDESAGARRDRGETPGLFVAPPPPSTPHARG